MVVKCVVANGNRRAFEAVHIGVQSWEIPSEEDEDCQGLYSHVLEEGGKEDYASEVEIMNEFDVWVAKEEQMFEGCCCCCCCCCYCYCWLELPSTVGGEQLRK